jgi:glyoxylase-like metal-dependent hydrolase (beta-lactamase superfamily II)
VGRWLGNLDMVDAWQVVYTPGHTTESICLYEPEKQILLAGDTLVGFRAALWVNPFCEDAEVLAMSLLTLERLAVKIVYPGHGRPVRGAQAFQRALRRTAPRRFALPLGL